MFAAFKIRKRPRYHAWNIIMFYYTISKGGLPVKSLATSAWPWALLHETTDLPTPTSHMHPHNPHYATHTHYTCTHTHTHTCTQGCLKPIHVLIPEQCLLDPSDTSAVVGGNVLTCQRIVDVVFKAFSTCAASQGCMNNITFGDESFGYYETVAGGAGAVSSLLSVEINYHRVHIMYLCFGDIRM